MWAIWVVAAFGCLGSGVAVISFSNPFYSALALIGNLASLAVLYLLLSAEFLAAAQVLVYAGAVMVMFLFVIAYIGRDADAPFAGGPGWQALAARSRRGRSSWTSWSPSALKAGGRLSDESDVDGFFGGPYESARSFSPTTCSRSRSPRSCCSWRRSAA